MGPKRLASLAAGQSPKIMILTCSDSRVDAAIATKTTDRVGEFFYHKNVGGSLTREAEAGLDFALSVLKVHTVMPLTHTGCGGINAALGHVFDKVALKKEYAHLDEQIIPLIQENRERLLPLDRKSQATAVAMLLAVDNAKRVCESEAAKAHFGTDQFPLIVPIVKELSTGRYHRIPIPVERWIEQKLLPENYNELHPEATLPETSLPKALDGKNFGLRLQAKL